MTIHTDHPFADAGGDRDPARRLRGRLSGRVTLWTTGDHAEARGREGLTVSSAMVAGGDPGAVLGLIDPDSDLGAALDVGSRVAVSLLDWEHRALADAFAGVTPAPGGPWRLAGWTGRDHPPVPVGCRAYALTEVEDLTEVGWSLLVRARIDEVRIPSLEASGDPAGPTDELVHHRGRYRRMAAPGGT